MVSSNRAMRDPPTAAHFLCNLFSTDVEFIAHFCAQEWSCSLWGSLKCSRWKSLRCHRALEHVSVGVCTCWFSKTGECPAPWSLASLSNPVLTLSRILPHVRHYKETTTSLPSSTPSFLVLSGYHSDETEEAVGLDLNSVAVETRHGQTWAGAGQSCMAEGEQGGSTVKDLKNYKRWKNIALDENPDPKRWRGENERNNEQQRKETFPFTLWADKTTRLCDKWRFIQIWMLRVGIKT